MDSWPHFSNHTYAILVCFLTKKQITFGFANCTVKYYRKILFGTYISSCSKGKMLILYLLLYQVNNLKILCQQSIFKF